MLTYSMKMVPSINFELHTSHCVRFLWRCPECGESMNLTMKNTHIDTHQPVWKIPFF